MASITWSTTLSAGSYSGATWQSYSLSSGGSTLPSNAVITNVEYGVTAYVGNYSSGSSYKFNLYAIAVNGGAYTTTQYSSSSATTLTGTINAQTSSSNSSESSASTGSFQSGTYKVWRSGTSRTYLKLVDCDFASDKTVTSAYSSSSIGVKLRLNSTFSGTTYITAISVTVSYTVPSLSWSTNLTASQVNDQVKLTWDSAPTYSGGSGTCQLAIHNGTGWIAGELSESLRSYTLTPTAYGTSITYAVAAWYSGLTVSNSVAFTASAPTLSWDNAAPSVTDNGDGTLTITWNKAVGSYGPSGSAVSYKLYVAASSGEAGELVGTYASASATIEAPSKDSYYYVVVAYSTKSSTSSRTYYAAHRTVKRWNGSGWDELIVYCYTGSSFVECIPYRWNGSSWDLLSH